MHLRPDIIMFLKALNLPDKRMVNCYLQLQNLVWMISALWSFWRFSQHCCSPWWHRQRRPCSRQTPVQSQSSCFAGPWLCKWCTPHLHILPQTWKIREGTLYSKGWCTRISDTCITMGFGPCHKGSVTCHKMEKRSVYIKLLIQTDSISSFIYC